MNSTPIDSSGHHLVGLIFCTETGSISHRVNAVFALIRLNEVNLT